MKRIDTHEAMVKTCRVEVKTLQVSGKQVTLSVFRQLQLAPLIDPMTGQLNGIPWGKVNYFWGDCRPDHLHVVWQSGDELRRDCVWGRRPAATESEEEGKFWQLRDTVAVLLRGVIARRQLDGEATPTVKDEDGNDCFHFAVGESGWWRISRGLTGGNPEVDASFRYLSFLTEEEAAARRQSEKPGEPETPYISEYRARRALDLRRDLQKTYDSARARAGQPGLPGADQLMTASIAKMRDYWNAQKEQKRLRAEWQKRYAELELLDQLFIAV